MIIFLTIICKFNFIVGKGSSIYLFICKPLSDFLLDRWHPRFEALFVGKKKLLQCNGAFRIMQIHKSTVMQNSGW